MNFDKYVTAVLDGILFDNSKVKNVSIVGIGGWGKIYKIIFENNKEIAMKICKLYYKNYHEIENIKKIKDFSYICEYYGYTTINNKKYEFVSRSNKFVFNGALPKLPNHVFKKIIPEETYSYFNIFMEYLIKIPRDDFLYKNINVTYFIYFVLCVVKGLHSLSKNYVVHGDIHKLANIGLLQVKNNNFEYKLPKIFDFGSIKSQRSALVFKNNDWILKTYKKEKYYKWPPEMLGCTPNGILNKKKYMDNKCDVHNGYATKKSDIFIFFKGAILKDMLKIQLDVTYLTKNDKLYNLIKNTIVNRFKQTGKYPDNFINDFSQIMMDIIDPDYTTRSDTGTVINKLEQIFKYLPDSHLYKL